MPEKAAIDVDGVSVSFPLYHGNARSLKKTVFSTVTGRMAADARNRVVVEALRGIDLHLRPGDRLALVGGNGAGKTTLLRVLAGIYEPVVGRMRVRGSLNALLDPTLGMNPELTGRENIMLRGLYFGLDGNAIEGLAEDVARFAELTDFLDLPVRIYSSGMVVRLGFAVATSVVPEVLITDEVLAVGDESFQKKCITWLEEYRANGGTLLLCSHSMFHIQKLCQQAIWLDGGQIRMQGTSADVTRSYLAWHEEKTRAQKKPEPGETSPVAVERSADIYQVNDMSLNGKLAGEALIITMGGGITVSGSIYSPDGRTPNVAVGFVRADGTPIYGVISEMDGYVLTRKDQHLFEYSIVFDDLPLLPGRYVARSHALDPEGLRLFDQVEMPFDISGDSRELGYCRLKHHWVSQPKA